MFDGHKSSPYVETDTTGPLSVHGRSKLAGEQAVQACKRHLTLRTSWVISAYGLNFIQMILRLAGEREASRVVADQFGPRTSAALLTEVTAKALSRMKDQPAGDPRWGLNHLVAAGETSWHGLARHVIARASNMGLPLKAKPEAVVAITTEEYPTPPMRPLNSDLT